LSTANTPRVVPVTFLNPIAPIRVAEGSQSNVYGRLCLVLKDVFAFGESFESP
jgi:hypothetical protein